MIELLGRYRLCDDTHTWSQKLTVWTQVFVLAPLWSTNCYPKPEVRISTKCASTSVRTHNTGHRSTRLSPGHQPWRSTYNIHRCARIEVREKYFTAGNMARMKWHDCVFQGLLSQPDCQFRSLYLSPCWAVLHCTVLDGAVVSMSKTWLTEPRTPTSCSAREHG